jgi:hypothetical protein
MLIALDGLSGSGKTTVANYLTENHCFIRYRFAEPLVPMLKLIGLTDADLSEPKRRQPHDLLGGKTPLDALRSLGIDWARDMIDKNFWARHWLRTTPTSVRVVADNCRFDNEAEAAMSIGGSVYRIIRPGITRENHPAEAGVSDSYIDGIIENDGSLEDLYDKIDKIVGV